MVAEDGSGQGFTPSSEYYRHRGALLSRDVYETNKRGYTEPRGFDLVRRVDQGGFQAALYRDRATGQYIVSYAGTEDARDWLANVELISHPTAGQAAPGEPVVHGGGRVPAVSRSALDPYVLQAESFYRESAALVGERPHVTGHSQGGFLAQIVGTKEEAPTTTFMAPNVPDVLRDHYSIRSTPGNVTNYRRETDYVIDAVPGTNLGQRAPDAPARGGLLENHSIVPPAEEAEAALDGYLRDPDPAEVDEALEAMGIEPEPASEGRPISEDPTLAEAPEPGGGSVESAPLEKGDAEPGDGGDASVHEEHQAEAPHAEESLEQPADAPSAVEPAEQQADAGEEFEQGVDPEDDTPKEGVEPEPPQDDPYKNYKRYAAEREDQVTEIGVADIDGYESPTLEELNRRWDEDAARIQEELGAVEIGVTRLGEDDPMAQLDQIASGMDPNSTVEEFRTTLSQDRAAASIVAQQAQQIEAERQQRERSDSQALQQGLEAFQQGYQLGSAISGATSPTLSGVAGPKSSAELCPQIRAQAIQQIQAIESRMSCTGMCGAHRCNLEMARIYADAANRCPEVGAADRARVAQSVREAENGVRAACN